jgi:ubiquinone/menaquinone biosynthesis C-methylase UbiE
MILDRMKQWALDYHHRTSRIPQGERVTRSIVGHIEHAASLLDVGCGDGNNATRVAQAVGATKLEGVDVHVRPTATIHVTKYDGLHLPFPDGAFEAVTMIDVLHHCDEPQQVLREIIRVASRVVAIKDHFAFGPVSNKLLYYMDLAGNAKDAIPSPGTYFSPRKWVEMIHEAGGRVTALDWPLKTHDLPWRIVGWPELQFTAKIEPR